VRPKLLQSVKATGTIRAFEHVKIALQVGEVGADGLLGTLGALGALGAFGALGALGTFGAVGTLGAPWCGQQANWMPRANAK
jgi:hypothetical protein